MPTYSYRCIPGGHTFDRSQRITETPVAVCPECGGEVERVISGGGGVLFKGSGFYATDYRTPSYREKARKEKEGESGSGAGGSEAGGDKGKAPSDGGGEKGKG